MLYTTRNRHQENKPKNPKEKADEFLPEGSAAEIRKRLSQIDEALSKATGKEQISKLKTERINTAIELAKAEKLIQIQSITEQVNENEKLWKQYYSAVISIGKNPADEIYKDLISESKNHISFLEKKKEELTKKSEQKDKKGNSLITEQEKEEFLAKEPGAKAYFHPWLGAEEFINGKKRFCL